MDQTTQAPPPSGPTPPPPPYAGPPPGGSDTFSRFSQRLASLRRSRSDRVFTGVCGGVARGLGLDPLFVRVLVAVLALVGGAGVALYVLGWLLLPEDDGRRSVAERAARRSAEPGSRRPILLAVLLVVAGLIAFSFVFDGWDGPVLLLLVVVGLLVWVDRRDDSVQRAQGAAAVWSAAASVTPGAGAAPTAAAPPTSPLAQGATAVFASSDAGQPPTSPPLWLPPAAPPPGPPPPRAPRSVLFAATICFVLIGLGLLGAADASGARVADGAYPALALAIVGAALVAGAWVGRSRGLIVVGLVLAVFTAGALAADRAGQYGRDRVDVTVRPTSVAELPASAEYGVGSATYDLRGIDFTTADASMRLSIGAGELVVIVPPDVDVTVDASAGLGATTLFTDSSGGPGQNRTLVDRGADGVGGGSLDLTLQAGLGHLEVRRG